MEHQTDDDLRPEPDFQVGDAVALRRNPAITGTVTELVWSPRSAMNWVPRWDYLTSWGSGYPAHELVFDRSDPDNQL